VEEEETAEFEVKEEDPSEKQEEMAELKAKEEHESKKEEKASEAKVLPETVGVVDKSEFSIENAVVDDKQEAPMENPAAEGNGLEIVDKEDSKASPEGVVQVSSLSGNSVQQSVSHTSCYHGDSEYEMDAMERYEAEEKEIHSKSIRNRRVILAVGRQKSGKSTALSNIFNLRFETSWIHTYSRTISTQGKDMVVIDTPGLGEDSKMDKKIMEEIRTELKRNDFTLVYCLSISPDSALGQQDRSIVELLHWHLGYSIWSKCVLLLTFSDTTRGELYGANGSVDDYKYYVKTRAKEFFHLVRSCGASVPGVLTVYDYENYFKLMSSDLVAVPVGKSESLKEAELSVVPGIGSSEERHWTYFAGNEIRRKTCKVGHFVFRLRKHIRESFIDVSMCSLIASFGCFLYGLSLDSSSETYRTYTVLNVRGYNLQALVLGYRNYWAFLGFSACWLTLFPFGVFWVARKWRRGHRQLQGEREAVSRISY